LPPHRLIVAIGFQVVGWVVGLPSFLLALALGAGAIMVGSGPKPQTAHYLSATHYGIAGLLTNAATWVAGVLAVVNEFAAWVLWVLTVLAFVVTVVAFGVWLVGRGLGAAAAWARVLAALMIAALAGVGLLVISLLTTKAALVDATGLAACGYGLWVLGWRFKPPRIEESAAS
jgi:hypothetical protein